ncbi:MAG: glycosyltransferase family 2 protein, partial [Snowella sp.]|nr:glycosyltransferase family 2 protein [Snowella sp.]
MVSVSVIIPCYNSAQTIERAIQSVAQQSLKPQEVIVIDDASSDNTIEILQSLQNHYGKDWLKLVTLEKNAGPSFARNQGWNLASQDYIAFLDSDEAWHPQKNEIQSQWMLANPNVAISGSDGIFPPYSSSFEQPESYNQYQVTVVKLSEILHSNLLQTSSVMLKRNLHYRFDPQKRYCEDHLLWMQIAVDHYPIYFFSLPLIYVFKSFGIGGLSQHLWEMRLGYIDNCWQLWKSHKISFLMFGKLVITTL